MKHLFFPPLAAAAGLVSFGAVLAAQVTTGPKRADIVSLEGRKAYYQDRSESYGVLFKNTEGSFGLGMGAGCAWFDMDGDGDEDLYAPSGQNAGALFRNDGDSFADVMAGSGIGVSPLVDPIAVRTADYDQDGRSDVYLMTTGQNYMFRNEGGGQFSDKTAVLGVSGGSRFSTGASFADFDLDGDLDLYVGHYIRILNFPYHYGEPNQLFMNLGTVFADFAPALGVDNVGVFGPSVPGYPYESPEGQPTAGCTLATATCDYDEDGDPDLQVGNDFGEWVIGNTLYRNDVSGGLLAFADVSAATGFDTRPHYNMGIYPRDFDHDGDWDFYLSNLGDNLLLRNDGGQFVDGTYAAGPVDGVGPTGKLLTSWATVWEDVDNDSWEDLIVCNGHMPSASFIANELRSANTLWMNQGDGTFERVPDVFSGLADLGSGRGLAWVDLQSDGFPDFYVQNNGADWIALPGDRSRLFVNKGLIGADNHWFELDLAGRFSNREGIGARIDAEVDGTVLKRQVLADPIFESSPTLMVHFGLGSAEQIDRMTVHWPSGVVQTLVELPADQRIQLLEPAVTGAGIQPIAYDPVAEMLTLRADVENHDTVPQGVSAMFELRAKSDGSVLLKKSLSGTLPGGSILTLTVNQAVPQAAYAALQGSAVELVVSCAASGGQDSDMLDTSLP